MSASGATFVIHKYRIDRHGSGGEGRNRANIDSGVTEFRTDGIGAFTKKTYSADAMKQDSQWDSLEQSVTINPTYTQSVYKGQVEFIFDKDDYDPRCTATLPAS